MGEIVVRGPEQVLSWSFSDFLLVSDESLASDATSTITSLSIRATSVLYSVFSTTFAVSLWYISSSFTSSRTLPGQSTTLTVGSRTLTGQSTIFTTGSSLVLTEKIHNLDFQIPDV